MLAAWSFGLALLSFVVAESFLQFAAPHAFSETIYDIVAFLGAITFAVLVRVRSSGRTAAMVMFWLGMLFFGAVALGAASAALPYIIYPSFTIFNSFTDPQSAGILFAVFAVGAVITTPALALLYSLFAAQ